MTDIWHDGEWVEECPNPDCDGGAVVERGQTYICPTCDGACYIPHACEA